MERPPYQSVRVNFSNSDYQNICEDFGGGHEAWPAWRELGDLLAYRSGWHFDFVNRGKPLWSLGVLGESRLNISVDGDSRYHCYNRDRNDEATLDSIAEVEDWLGPREEEVGKPSEVSLNIARSDDWRILKVHAFRLSVSWSDGYSPQRCRRSRRRDSGRRWRRPVNRAGEMLCHLFGAPTELAPELTMELELDSAATQRLRFGM
ncbi:hypothetical protein [Streptomyces sp. MAI_2237]